MHIKSLEQNLPQTHKSADRRIVAAWLCILTLLGTLAHSRAATWVSGTIVNQVWTSAGSPYYVNGNILVAGLTISNGVFVYFQGNYVFEVQGILKAYGKTNSPVVFYRPGTVGWQGIYFNHSSPGSEMVCCVVSNSVKSGIRILNANPIIRECTIAYNSASNGYGGGISADIQSGDLVLKRCLIANNSVYYTGRDTAGGGGVSASMCCLGKRA